MPKTNNTEGTGVPRCLSPKEVEELIENAKKKLRARGPRTRELPGLTPEARHFVVKVVNVRTGEIARDYGMPPGASQRRM